MQDTIDKVNEGMNQGMNRAQEVYDGGVKKARELSQMASEKSKEAFGVADEWVHDNSWLALGIVAAVGLVAGLLISRCASED